MKHSCTLFCVDCVQVAEWADKMIQSQAWQKDISLLHLSSVLAIMNEGMKVSLGISQNR
jgi:hypothetical protein